VGAAGTTIATVPSGEVWILKDATLFCSAVTTTDTIRLRLKRAQNVVVLQKVGAVTSDIVEFFQRFEVLEAGDTVNIASPTANGITVNYWLSGAKLVT